MTLAHKPHVLVRNKEMQDVELNDVKQERLQGGNPDSVLVFLFCLIVRFMFYFVLVFEDLLLVSLFEMVQK